MEINYVVCKAKIAKGNKKGVIAGKVLHEFTSNKIFTPGTMLKIDTKEKDDNGKKIIIEKRIRCIDHFESYSNIIIE